MSDKKVKELIEELREVLGRAERSLNYVPPQDKEREVTLRDLQTIAANLIKDGKKDAVVEALGALGAAKFSELAEADYSAMWDSLEVVSLREAV